MEWVKEDFGGHILFYISKKNNEGKIREKDRVVASKI
jgi:hypothetical protein